MVVMKRRFRVYQVRTGTVVKFVGGWRLELELKLQVADFATKLQKLLQLKLLNYQPCRIRGEIEKVSRYKNNKIRQTKTNNK